MQIIIIQTEIETAIRNHILNQIHVKEGMRIDIDLSATRGPEGFKATIDIVPSDSPVTNGNSGSAETQAPPPTTTVLPKVTPAIRRAPPVAVAKAAVPAAAIEAEEQAQVLDNENAPAADVAAEASEPAAETVATPAATPAPVPGRSLFGGLNKPTNS